MKDADACMNYLNIAYITSIYLLKRQKKKRIKELFYQDIV